MQRYYVRKFTVEITPQIIRTNFVTYPKKNLVSGYPKHSSHKLRLTFDCVPDSNSVPVKTIIS